MSMSDTERWMLEVSGRVQLVNYRSRIQQLAEELGIVGCAWNDEKNERKVHVAHLSSELGTREIG